MTTYHLGLLGYPVNHSLSPKLQNAALRAAGLEGEYQLYPVDPARPDLLKTLLERVRTAELHGLNVTIPHKQTVIPLLDELTPIAQAIGAVNVIYRENARLIGDNTDAPGFLSDLDHFLRSSQRGEGSKVKEKSALILGAGGSARAIVFALLNDGWNLSILARRPNQAQSLLESYKTAGSQYDTLIVNNLKYLDKEPALIVNTTPVGMTPSVKASPWPEEVAFPPEALVYDLIYNPRETLLVRQAKAAGLRATTGLGMLIEQALLGFKIWTGHTVPREVMFSAVEA